MPDFGRSANLHPLTVRVGSSREVLAVVLLAAIAMYVLRHGLRIGSIDDFIPFHLTEADMEQFHWGLYNWGRWLTILELKFLEQVGIPVRLAERNLYPVFELSLALMNTLFVIRLWKHLDLIAVSSVLFLGMTVSWLILANFDVCIVSLLTCFFATSVLIVTPMSERRFLPILFSVTLAAASSYQGFLYPLVAIVTMIVIGDVLSSEDQGFGKAALELVKSAVCMVLALVTYLILTKFINLWLDLPGRFTVGSKTSFMFGRHLGEAVSYLFYHDWLLPAGKFAKTAVNWRLATYVVIGLLLASLVVLSKQRFRILLLTGLAAAAFAMLAMQPLQLLSGHKNIPLRAFGFANYVSIATILILLGFWRANSLFKWQFLTRAVGLFLAMMTFVLALHTSAIVDTFLRTRERDLEWARAIETFVIGNKIPGDTVIATALSHRRDRLDVRYAGPAGIDALASTFLRPSKFLKLLRDTTSVSPSPVTQQQQKLAKEHCEKFGRDGAIIRMEYVEPLLIVCM
ncbi:MAG: hypothetical protein KJ587_18735 [Alphaproteobacteria bacterium]|nr:hypothetical protein [Alphaproteobacteria bacterium]